MISSQNPKTRSTREPVVHIFYYFINGRRYKMNYFHLVSLLPSGGNPLTVFPRPHRLSQQPLHITTSRPGATRRTKFSLPPPYDDDRFWVHHARRRHFWTALCVQGVSSVMNFTTAHFICYLHFQWLQMYTRDTLYYCI